MHQALNNAVSAIPTPSTLFWVFVNYKQHQQQKLKLRAFFFFNMLLKFEGSYSISALNNEDFYSSSDTEDVFCGSLDWSLDCDMLHFPALWWLRLLRAGFGNKSVGIIKHGPF